VPHVNLNIARRTRIKPSGMSTAIISGLDGERRAAGRSVPERERRSRKSDNEARRMLVNEFYVCNTGLERQKTEGDGTC